VRAGDPRALSTRGGSAYLKIAEGCNRRCSFCVIPSMRGKQRSRPIDDVVREARELVGQGVVELNLISQDTIAYGRDLAGAPSLADLVERVADVRGVRWVRIFYLYPERVDDRLIELLAKHPRVLPYVDMPLQHAADAMLRRMRRGHGGARLRTLVERLRRDVPELTFRTAFIVGHPGETAAEFEELCELVRWARFERVGVFRYSDEDTSHSATLDAKVPARTAAARYKKLMSLARRIAREQNRALVGRELEVLIEGASDEHEHVLTGRHRGQAPEIDGQVFLTGTEQLARIPRPGEIVRARVVQASDYDLAAEVVAQPERAALVAADKPRRSLRVLPTDGRRPDYPVG
jgi:ribosomal protein S12 methylthiotransferase